MRLAYDGEVLELMAPLDDHEAYTRLLDMLLTAIVIEWDVNLYGTGSTTLRAEPLGAEPDASYYIQHAPDVDGIERIDLRTSPPPDLVVEIHLSRRRMDTFALYARLGVPEFWRLGSGALRGFALRDGTYREITTSIVILGLPLDTLAAFLERRLESDRRRVLLDWQTWLREHRP